jgi:hypothetical protein
MEEDNLQKANFEVLMENYGPQAWTFTVEEDSRLLAQWFFLAQLPAGTLGAAVWQHYQSHSLITPGYTCWVGTTWM